MKPPYGVIAAIDVNKGDLMWQVPHGDTPDNVRNHPLLKGMNIPKTGQSGSVGVVITKTLVIAGDPQFTTRDGVRGAMLRAYDKKTGAQVGEVLHAGAEQRIADDLLGRRPAVHHRRGQRRGVYRRIHFIRVAADGVTDDGARGTVTRIKGSDPFFTGMLEKRGQTPLLKGWLPCAIRYDPALTGGFLIACPFLFTRPGGSHETFHDFGIDGSVRVCAVGHGARAGQTG